MLYKLFVITTFFKKNIDIICVFIKKCLYEVIFIF